MTTIHVADDGGDEITLFKYNGFIYPNFHDNGGYITQLSSVEIRPDDILLCAYPKSGTHWVWEMTRLLLAGVIDNANIDKMSAMIEYLPESAYKDHPSPRILNSHMLFRNLPQQVKEKKPKIIYVTRNPKDVIVSYYNFEKKLPHAHYHGKWENYLRPAVQGKFSYGSWFDYVIDWNIVTTSPSFPILTLNYEDIHEDAVREAEKICKYLDLQRSEDFIKQVCQHCRFNAMKNIKKSDSLTSSLAYRKGEVGDWKNWFTVAQNEWFDQFYREKMKDCPMTFRYSLNTKSK